jgi:hypothetical protein
MESDSIANQAMMDNRTVEQYLDTLLHTAGLAEEATTPSDSDGVKKPKVVDKKGAKKRKQDKPIKIDPKVSDIKPCFSYCVPMIMLPVSQLCDTCKISVCKVHS